MPGQHGAGDDLGAGDHQLPVVAGDVALLVAITRQSGSVTFARGGVLLRTGAGWCGIEAVVYDLDGVLVDSEPVWEQVRRWEVADLGGHWAPDAQRRLMGMSTPEWARYLSEDLGAGLPPARSRAREPARTRPRLLPGRLVTAYGPIAAMSGLPPGAASKIARRCWNMRTEAGIGSANRAVDARVNEEPVSRPGTGIVLDQCRLHVSRVGMETG